VINSNVGPILHLFRDTATYWPKVANFLYLFSFSAFALLGVTSFEFMEKLYGF